MIRRIRDLLYDQGFTISGARNKLVDLSSSSRERDGGDLQSDLRSDRLDPDEQKGELVKADEPTKARESVNSLQPAGADRSSPLYSPESAHACLQQVRRELFEIRQLLT